MQVFNVSLCMITLQNLKNLRIVQKSKSAGNLVHSNLLQKYFASIIQLVLYCKKKIVLKHKSVTNYVPRKLYCSFSCSIYFDR